MNQQLSCTRQWKEGTDGIFEGLGWIDGEM